KLGGLGWPGKLSSGKIRQVAGPEGDHDGASPKPTSVSHFIVDGFYPGMQPRPVLLPVGPGPTDSATGQQRRFRGMAQGGGFQQGHTNRTSGPPRAHRMVEGHSDGGSRVRAASGD